MADKRSYVLQIAGKRFVIRSDAEESYVQALADYVDQQIKAVESATRPAALHSLAVMAALNIADELFQQREQHQQWKTVVRERSSSLLGYLDEEVERYSK